MLIVFFKHIFKFYFSNRIALRSTSLYVRSSGMIFTHCTIFGSNFTTAIILRQKDSISVVGFIVLKANYRFISITGTWLGLFFVSYWLTTLVGLRAVGQLPLRFSSLTFRHFQVFVGVFSAFTVYRNFHFLLHVPHRE
jgi:hypothetical protein